MQKIDVTTMLEQATQADEAGFLAVAKELRTKASRLTRMVQAYEFYRVVKQDAVDAFNAKLKAKTSRPLTPEDPQYRYGYESTICDQLKLEPLAGYPGVPPADVFAAVKEAKERKIFDSFEVASVQPVATHVKLPDPIVFGRIEGCTDRFYIAEWGTDVNIVDLIGKNGG